MSEQDTITLEDRVTLFRQVEVYENGSWRPTSMVLLEPYDVFRMYEPDGKPVMVQGFTMFLATGKPVANGGVVQVPCIVLPFVRNMGSELVREAEQVVAFLGQLRKMKFIERNRTLTRLIEEYETRLRNAWLSETGADAVPILEERYFRIMSADGKLSIGMCANCGRLEVAEEEPDVVFQEISKEEFEREAGA